MTGSIVNSIIVIVLIIAGGILLWHVFRARQETLANDRDPYEDISKTEERIEETEEYLQRMERLSKRSTNDEDDKKT
ncbi:MAG: hypothetical protein ACFE0Q_16140 [Anaerolineae bacterium]